MYLVMYVAWYLLQCLLGTALATPMPQYLEILSNAFTTITMTVDTPPYIVVSNPATTISIMEGVVGTVGPATASPLSTLGADPPTSSTALSVSVTSTSSTSSSATVLPAATTPPAVLATFPSNTASAAGASATILTSSAVAAVSPTSNNTAVFVAPGPVTPLSAVPPSAGALIQAPISSNPLNSTVVFSNTGNPIVNQTASPPNPLNPTAISSSTGIPVASQIALPSSPLNSTVIFSSTGLPSASPALIASSPPVTSAPSSVLSASSTTATNVAPNSVQSAFNVVLSTNLAAIPGGIKNQAPVPSITVPLPLISSFPAAANPTANPDGSHKVIPWTVPGTNVTIIATMAAPNQAPAISAISYEYTIGSMQYYISGVLNTTGNAPLNASHQDPFYWDIGYGCWVEFNTNPFLGASGAQLLTYSVIYNALQGMKDALLTSGWWYLAFLEIRVGPQGQVVGYATVSPSIAPKGSAPITNIDDALQALEQPVGGSSSAAAVAAAPSIQLPGAPVDGGTAHKRRSWRWALGV